MAVGAEIATGVVAKTEVASLRRVDLHTTASAPVVLGSQVLLNVPVKKWELLVYLPPSLPLSLSLSLPLYSL